MRISDWSSDVCSSDLVAREIFSRRNDHRIAPALVEIGFAALGDHGSLQGPERIGVGEIAVVAEQVGDDREAARIGVEQRLIDLDRRAAEQPFLQLMAGRSRERCVGKECVSTWCTRLSTVHYKKKNKIH